MDKSRYNEIIQNWITEVEENADSNAELTLRYCMDIIQYGIKTKDDALISFGYYYSGMLYYTLNDGILFYEAITNALFYLNRIEDWELMSKCYNFLGIASMNRGNVAVALDYYINAIKYCVKAGADLQKAIIGINIGALYNQCGRYNDAISHIESSLEFFSSNPKDPYYHDHMMCAYGNLAKAYLLKGKLEESRKCFDSIYADHIKDGNLVDRVAVLCAEAMYFHVAGEDENCEKCIAEIHEHTTANMPIMDMFDDYYDYCRILLERDKTKEFWNILDIMEPMVKSVNLSNLMLRLLALKIKFYRKKGQNSKYLKTCSQYYELSEQAEKESRAMTNSIINLRKNFEEVNKEKEEVQIRNLELQEKSETDPLTKLNNRFRLNDYTETAFQKAMEKGTPLAVEILDIDNFKGYNDYYGHQTGDECLIKLAEVLKSMEKEHNAFVARYGGDEFILIYENISKEQAIIYAEELRRKMINQAIVHAKTSAAEYVTISQGICWDIPTDENKMWDFLHTADNMLYRVKQKERNNYCVGSLKESEAANVIGKSWNS